MAPTPLPRPGDLVGFWGAPSSTLNWCETNYEVSFYMAEFWNTLTNLGMIIPAIYGMLHCRRQGIESRYTYNFLTLLFIGIGSWMYHMTLNYEMQLLDELPMLYGASYVVYCLYTARNELKKEQDKGPPRREHIVATLLTLNCIVATIIYLKIREPIFFQAMFAIIVSAGYIISLHHNYYQYSRLGLKLLFMVFASTMVAFALWNIDTFFCKQLTNTRERMLRPNPLLKYLSPLTQLHGWWHIIGGYGFYLQVFACVQQRLLFLKINHSPDEKWGGFIKKIDVIDPKMLRISKKHPN